MIRRMASDDSRQGERRRDPDDQKMYSALDMFSKLVLLCFVSWLCYLFMVLLGFVLGFVGLLLFFVRGFCYLALLDIVSSYGSLLFGSWKLFFLFLWRACVYVVLVLWFVC